MTDELQPDLLAREPAALDWTELAAAIAVCTACGLAGERTQTVPGTPIPGDARGPHYGDRLGRPLLLVGEAPGAAEDASGVPFCGRSGMLLDRLLAAAGGDRELVGVVNVVKCRPPGNRVPARAEKQACAPFLSRQLRLAGDGVLVVALGLSAVQWFLGPRVKLGEVRGRVHHVAQCRTGAVGLELDVLPTYHPSAALRFGPSSDVHQLLAADLGLAVQLSKGIPPSGLSG